MAEKDITYTWEKYDPNEEVQQIRTPAEILHAPGEGTCLDLAALFCGLCQGWELLPLLIVLKGHALAAVSLTHRLDQWKALGRKELNLFPRGILTKPEPLRELVDSGAYVAIECTGFARFSGFPDFVPEGKGRSGGVLAFQRAVAAGREQLEQRDRPFQFALDIAVAQYEWKIQPLEITRNPAKRLMGRIWDNIVTSGKLVGRPVQTAMELLAISDDARRFGRALFFLALMIGFWFLIEMPLFYWRGMRFEGAAVNLFLFFGWQLLLAVFLFLAEGALLHIFLRLFCVPSSLVYTLPCFCYTSVLLPAHAILSYPTDILKYLAIDKAGTIHILLNREWLDRVLNEVSSKRNIVSQLYQSSNIAITVLVIAWIICLSLMLSGWYKTRWWRCLLGTLLLFALILYTQDFQDFAYAFAEQVFSRR